MGLALKREGSDNEYGNKSVWAARAGGDRYHEAKRRRGGGDR